MLLAIRLVLRQSVYWETYLFDAVELPHAICHNNPMALMYCCWAYFLCKQFRNLTRFRVVVDILWWCHTSNCACNLRKTDHTRNVYSSTIATSKTTASTADKLCPHTALAMNRQLWLRQALSALNARNSKSAKPAKLENQQLGILNPSPTQVAGTPPLHNVGFKKNL